MKTYYVRKSFSTFFGPLGNPWLNHTLKQLDLEPDSEYLMNDKIEELIVAILSDAPIVIGRTETARLVDEIKALSEAHNEPE